MEDMPISRYGIVVAEPSLRELPERQLTPQRRANLRERVTVENISVHVVYWQSDRTR